jgi:2-polyprenyl-3-methyl-5-hydroxy-6-metoxy-1,4-benzoquinol methylase
MGKAIREFYAGIEQRKTAEEEPLLPRLDLFARIYHEERGRRGAVLSVLDVGCGRSAPLAKRIAAGDTYVATDLVPPTAPISDFVLVDLNEARLCDALSGRRFDVIFCSEVIEHVFDPTDCWVTSGTSSRRMGC